MMHDMVGDLKLPVGIAPDDLLMNLDDNGDGMVTIEELAKCLMRMFLVPDLHSFVLPRSP